MHHQRRRTYLTNIRDIFWSSTEILCGYGNFVILHGLGFSGNTEAKCHVFRRVQVGTRRHVSKVIRPCIRLSVDREKEREMETKVRRETGLSAEILDSKQTFRRNVYPSFPASLPSPGSPNNYTSNSTRTLDMSRIKHLHSTCRP